MQAAIGYSRVSTQEQGRSGLGLAAQRFEIEAFGAREGFSVKSWHQDVQTGAGADALQLRPGLAAALKEAQAAHLPLIVSRLDRLSRNVHFITWLMEHRVHFIVAALGKDCDHFVLHIFASLAGQERKLISERCKAAAMILKRNGHKFGLARRPKGWQRKVSAMGRAALVKVANEQAEAYRMHIEWALRQPGIGNRPITFSGAATALNRRNIQSSMGGAWRGHQVQRMSRRLGLPYSSSIVPREEMRAKVRAAWKQNPDITSAQLISSLVQQHPLGMYRALALLRECRIAAACQSPMHKLIKWRIDDCTSARIRIAAIWTRHPTYTAQQVTRKLGPEFYGNVWWVRQIMHECWRASARHSPKQLRLGRRCYFSRRARSMTCFETANRAATSPQKFDGARAVVARSPHAAG